jgi:YVTN family beta-propeller protein
MGLPACTSDQDTRLLVVAPKANKLNVVGTCPHRMLARISVGVEPVAVKANPAGTLVLVSNTSGGSVTLMDIEAYTVLATVSLPPVSGILATPSAIAFSPDGLKAYIANHSDIAGAVFVLDMNSRMVTSTLSTGAFPAGLAVTPDGTELWVTCRGNSTVHVYDTLTNTEIKSIPEMEPLGIAFNPHGTRAYIAIAPDTGPGSLKVLDTSSFAEIASIQVGNLPSTVLVSPTGRFIFVNNLQSSFVSKIDAAHNVVLHNLKTRAPWRVMMMRR